MCPQCVDLGLHGHLILSSPFNTISIVASNYVPAFCGSWGYTPCLRTLIFINQHFMDLGLLDHGLVHL